MVKLPSEAHEVATQNGESVLAVGRTIVSGHEEVCQDETHSVQAQSLSEPPPHKSLEPKQTKIESTEDRAEGVEPIPSVQSEQPQETKPGTVDGEHVAIVDSSIVASDAGNDGAIKDTTSAATENLGDVVDTCGVNEFKSTTSAARENVGSVHTTDVRGFKSGTSAATENSGDVDIRAMVEDRPVQVTAENCVQTQGEDNDNWLDDWDLVVRRCVHCDRAFGTQQRVEDHLRRQHAPGSDPLELYPAPNRPDTAKFSDSEPPLVKIVENGDLILDVKLYSTWFLPRSRFQVASQALWAASPVFNAMFGPTSKFQERVNIRRANAFGYSPSVISLQDDPVAMECVLNVLFHRRSSLPRKYEFADVLNIAIVTDKYEMQDVMAGWAEPLLHMVETWAGEPGHENALFISWVFGYDAVFENMCTTLTLASQIVNNSFFLPPPAVALSEHTPSVVMKKLAEVRQERVQTMRELINNYHSLCVLTTSKYFRFCAAADQQRNICNAIQTGHFIQTYNNEELKRETFWSQTVVDIANRCLAIKPMMFPDGVMDLPSKASDYPHTLMSKPKNAHAACSWVNRITAAAKEAQLDSKKYTIRLSDFPSRRRA